MSDRNPPPPKTSRRLSRAVREPQMLDAALAVFSRVGYHAASMEEIARRAGVSKPMVYLYLGGKEDLFKACLRREGSRLLQAIVDAVAPWRPAPPEDQLWRGLRAFFQFVAAHRDGWQVLYRQARAQQPFATELAYMRERMVEVLAGLLRSAARTDSAGSDAAQTDSAGTDSARTVHSDDSIRVLSVTLVGAAESVADHLADQDRPDPDLAAIRVMNIVWLGTSQLLRGATWHPADQSPGGAGAAETGPPDGAGSTYTGG